MPSSSLVGAGVRLAPVQQRSSDRLDRVLTAAAELADERGYDEVTTGLIARRAGVSIGTVYRFFADKPAIFRALAAGHFEHYVNELEAALAERSRSGDSDWEFLVEACVDVYVQMLREIPGFRGFGDAIDPHVLATELGGSDPQDITPDNDTVLADRLLAIVRLRFGLRSSRRLRLAVLAAITAADGLLALAFRRDPLGDETVIAETKVMISGYLAAYFVSRQSRRQA